MIFHVYISFYKLEYNYDIHVYIFVGATRDIGSALTRLCMRHRSIENKLKAFTRYGSLLEI